VSLKINFVPEESTYTTEALNELETFLRFVCDEFNFRTKLGIVIANPFRQRFLFHHIIVGVCLRILEELRVFLLCGV